MAVILLLEAFNQVSAVAEESGAIVVNALWEISKMVNLESADNASIAVIAFSCKYASCNDFIFPMDSMSLIAFPLRSR